MNEFTLKPNLLLGVTSVPVQVDGGAVPGVWHDWAAAGRVRDGSDPAVAAGHWERWHEDVMLLRGMGVQCIRFGIDWARVEPEEGTFDDEALLHIKEELMLLIGMGVRPLVVLHQCADPVWFAKKGGWEKPDNLRCFVIYVEHVLRAVGHLVSEYLTFARPNAYVFNGWLYGLWPPGKKSLKSAMAVMSGICAAHIRAYRLIHDVRRELGFSDSRVSFALEYRVFVPRARMNPLHRAAAAELARLFQELPCVAMLTGEFRAPLKCPGKDHRGTFADFHAVDYDTRSAVAGLTERASAQGFKNDLGREIWPDGVFHASRKLLKLRPMNIYLTCGTCDVNDSFRSRFLYDSIKLVCESKLPVKRWYYDSFLDGFNWLDGCYARTGLVSVDFATMERSLKRSGEFYAKIIRRGGVTEKMYDKYVAEEEYHL